MHAGPSRHEVPIRLVHIVDHDRATCEIVAAHLRRAGYATAASYDAAGCRAALQRRRPDALIVNLDPGAGGLALLQQVKKRGHGVAVVAIEDRPHVEQAVLAMKAGAADVLTKPVDPQLLLRTLHLALQDELAAWRRLRRLERTGGALTPRERQVLERIAEGWSNKEVGKALGISPRTVEVHRARVLAKLGARNAAELAQMVLLAAAAGA